MVKKIYTTKSFFYATYINVGEKKIRITFRGGSNEVRGLNGTYSTTDEAIQNAIESMPEFKNGFITIKKIYGEQKSNDTTAKTSITPTKQEQAKEEVAEDTSAEMKQVPEANTKQKAARYLSAEYGFAYSDINTIEKIIKVGREHNVCFPNLK